jgi:hypothetical protein
MILSVVTKVAEFLLWLPRAVALTVSIAAGLWMLCGYFRIVISGGYEVSYDPSSFELFLFLVVGALFSPLILARKTG